MRLTRVFFFVLQGDYLQYECGLTVANARDEDGGEWECDFESYVKVGEDFFGYFEEEVSSLFRIFQLSSLLRVERGVVDTKLLKHSELLLSFPRPQCPRPLQPLQRSLKLALVNNAKVNAKFKYFLNMSSPIIPSLLVRH